MTDSNDMHITEGELNTMTADLVDMHEQSFPKMREALAEFGASVRHAAPASRRTFLMGGGVVAGGLVLAACSSSKKTTSGNGNSSPAPSSSSSGGGGKDNAALATNAGLENLAVFAYMTALSDAGKGKLGKVPPAIATFVTTAMKQHQDHAQAFNSALTNAGGTAFKDPDPALKAPVLAAYGKVKSLPDLAKLALLLENTAAETYIKQMSTMMSPDGLAAVATIAPVERQHAAILNFVLGQYPVPDTFVPLDLARPDTDAGVK
ncbi:MAG: ferritin-like domain-containing protein [Actinomycetota bacterium]|nr:ferritin-like domain-containing protein [Actinomycetota bacterium]